jgi:hypothetical protein
MGTGHGVNRDGPARVEDETRVSAQPLLAFSGHGYVAAGMPIRRCALGARTALAWVGTRGRLQHQKKLAWGVRSSESPNFNVHGWDSRGRPV